MYDLPSDIIIIFLYSKVVFVFVDFCGTPSVQYDSFLDSFACKVVDEHHIEGQEVGVSLCIFFVIYIIKGVMFVCLSVSMFCMAGQTAGPIETKLDTRTHVHPGSVSVKVSVKVILVCVWE